MARPSKKQLYSRKMSKIMSKLTPDNIKKLEEIYALDASMREIAYYLDVGLQTIYNWKEKNPKLFERLERIRQRPVLRARNTFVANLDQLDAAIKYLKSKRKEEFSERAETKSTVDVTVAIDEERKKQIADALENL